MQAYTENFGGRTNYNIFVPDNVNQDTEVLYYTINTSFTEKMKEDILKQNGDSIVIVPTNSPIVVGNETGGHQFQQEAIKSFNFVKEKYNLKTDQFSQAGFSSGYGPSIRTMSDYLKDNPEAGRQILISVDGCKILRSGKCFPAESARCVRGWCCALGQSDPWQRNGKHGCLDPGNAGNPNTEPLSKEKRCSRARFPQRRKQPCPRRGSRFRRQGWVQRIPERRFPPGDC